MMTSMSLIWKNMMYFSYVKVYDDYSVKELFNIVYPCLCISQNYLLTELHITPIDIPNYPSEDCILRLTGLDREIKNQKLNRLIKIVQLLVNNSGGSTWISSCLQSLLFFS